MTRLQTIEIAAKAALAALSQNATFPADIAAARKWLSDALAIDDDELPEPTESRERNCPSKHWNDGTDVCEDCGASLA